MKYSTLLCSLALALAAPHARAGDAAAEALFRAGREAAERGDDATACARFEESHRIEPAAGTVLNLALCYERRGQVASAWQRFREAKDRMPSPDERLELVAQKISALEARLPRLTVRVDGSSAGQKVLRDGSELGAGSLGVAVPVDPGAHRVELRVPGHAARVESVDVAEGESKEVSLQPGPAESEAPVSDGAASATTSAASDGSGARSAGFVLGGVGVVGIATSLVTGAMVLNRKSTVERECVGNVCSRAGVEAADSGSTLSTVSTVAFAAGAAALGVGVYLILSSKPTSDSARLSVTTERGASMLSFRGAF
ncbi:MAG: PEGA domain-containing protein [Polyangiaceae bacterium]